MLTAAEAFAGVGGFHLALESVGVNVVADVEIDKAARGVLHDRFPNTHHFEDIKDVTGDRLRAAGFVPERGIWCGGFPCQDVSVAGHRKGLADGTRSSLFYEFARVADECHPAWIVLENVPGLLSSRGGRDMGAVLGTLADLGYGFAYRVLDAQNFGVPQRRRRVFIVGRFGDDGSTPGQVLFESESGSGDYSSRGTARQETATVARGESEGVVNALTANMAGAGGGADDNTAQAGHIVAFSHTQGLDLQASTKATPTLRRGGDGAAILTYQKVIRSGARDENGDLPPEVWAQRDIASTRNTFDIGDARATELIVAAPLTAGSHAPNTSAPGRRQEDDVNLVCVTGDVTHTLTHEGHDASEDGTGRGTPIIAVNTGMEKWSDTQSADGTLAARDAKGTTTLAYVPAVRRLTPLECERLQGFPDGHTNTSWGKFQADSPRYKQMGNAVAVPCVTWIAERLVNADQLTLSEGR